MFVTWKVLASGENQLVSQCKSSNTDRNILTGCCFVCFYSGRFLRLVQRDTKNIEKSYDTLSVPYVNCTISKAVQIK